MKNRVFFLFALFVLTVDAAWAGPCSPRDYEGFARLNQRTSRREPLPPARSAEAAPAEAVKPFLGPKVDRALIEGEAVLFLDGNRVVQGTVEGMRPEDGTVKIRMRHRDGKEYFFFREPRELHFPRALAAADFAFRPTPYITPPQPGQVVAFRRSSGEEALGWVEWIDDTGRAKVNFVDHQGAASKTLPFTDLRYALPKPRQAPPPPGVHRIHNGESGEVEAPLNEGRFFARSDTGEVKYKAEGKNNEDSFLFVRSEDGKVETFVVLDGMGGHAGGDVASSAIAEGMQKQLRAGKDVEEVLRTAPEHVRAAYRRELGSAKMGAVAAAIQIKDGHLRIAHVGDAKAMVFYPGRATPVFETADHNVGNMLKSLGRTPAEGDYHRVTRAITADREAADVDVEVMKYAKGARILLASDGVTDNFRHDMPTLYAIVNDPQLTPKQAAEKIRAILRDRIREKRPGYKDDNITIAIAEL